MAAIMISIIPLQSSALSVLPGSGEPTLLPLKPHLPNSKSFKKEKKLRVKEAKKQVKDFKKEKKENKSANVEMWLLIVLAILLPPLAVYLHQGEINGKFWLSILFWFFLLYPALYMLYWL